MSDNELELAGQQLGQTIGNVGSANLAVTEALIAILIEKNVLTKPDLTELIDKIEADAKNHQGDAESDAGVLAAFADRLKRTFQQ